MSKIVACSCCRTTLPATRSDRPRPAPEICRHWSWTIRPYGTMNCATTWKRFHFDTFAQTFFVEENRMKVECGREKRTSANTQVLRSKTSSFEKSKTQLLKNTLIVVLRERSLVRHFQNVQDKIFLWRPSFDVEWQSVIIHVDDAMRNLPNPGHHHRLH